MPPSHRRAFMLGFTLVALPTAFQNLIMDVTEEFCQKSFKFVLKLLAETISPNLFKKPVEQSVTEL